MGGPSKSMASRVGSGCGMSWIEVICYVNSAADDIDDA